MKDIVAYRVLSNGSLRVRLTSGRERAATAVEWLALWRTDPRLTLALAR
ncbi:MAG: hypothetical protein ACM33T_11970 [Solirubrobacterales bacterium]